jgi:aryl-alcohol dehydrogenase-like predicted oxidoreductase
MGLRSTIATTGRVGLGAMPLSTAGRPDRETAIATVHAALDAGLDLIDTADAYCLAEADTGHNEVLVAEALASYGGAGAPVVVSTKGGHVRDANGGWHTDGRPEHILGAAEASRTRLGVDAIPLYSFHRPDPAVPFLESVGALRTLLDRGVVASVGLSNVDVSQLAAAAEIVPIAAVQNSFSPYDVSSRPVIEWCEAHEARFVAYAPLGGAERAGRLGDDAVTGPHAEVAARHGVSVAQVVLAWILSVSPVTVVIPGARRSATILDAIGAAALVLGPDEVESLHHTAGLID